VDAIHCSRHKTVVADRIWKDELKLPKNDSEVKEHGACIREYELSTVVQDMPLNLIYSSLIQVNVSECAVTISKLVFILM
jgi:hypothetical protein